MLYWLSLHQATCFPLCLMVADRRSVCVCRRCHLTLDVRHQMSPGLPGEDEQPEPCTLPCLPQSPAAASGVVVGVPSPSSINCWKWSSSSCPGCWEASLLTPGCLKQQAQPHLSPCLCLVLQPGWSVLALLLALGLSGDSKIQPCWCCWETPVWLFMF